MAVETRVDPARTLALARPVRLLVVLGCLSLLGPLSMDIYTPGLPTMADSLGAPAWAVQLTVALYLAGLGVGQLVAGPLSDVYGRRRPVLASLVLFAVASMLCAASPGIVTLVASRFLEGVTASAGVVIARAVIRDVATGTAGARYLSRLVLIYGLAPVVAPLLGGQILRVTSWRGVFFVLVGAAALVFVATLRVLPETLPPEQRRPGALRKTTATFGGLVRDRAFFGYALVLGFGTATLVGYVAGAPFVLQNVYGVSPQLYGVFFGVGAVAMIAGSQLNARLLARFGSRRLLCSAVGSMLLFGALLMVAVLGHLGLGPVTVCLVLLMGSFGFLPANAVALGMHAHPEIAGSASALLGLAQYGIAGLVTPLVGIGGKDTAIPMAAVILGLGIATAVTLATLTRGTAHEHETTVVAAG